MTNQGGLVMDSEIRHLIVEIVSIVVLLLIVIPICVNASSEYREKRDFLLIGEKASVDISNMGEYKLITINSGTDKTVKMNLMMRISKFSDDYLIYLDDEVFNIRDLEYTEDEDYQYYNLGLFDVEKEKVLQFRIKVKDKSYYDETISYGFYTEGYM